MTKHLLKLIAAGTLTLYAIPGAIAQYKPAAIFVMLNTEHNRVNKAIKAKWDKELAETRKDAEAVIVVTKNDFRDHYSLSPVYYFDDTNFNKLKQGTYDGIIKNEDGSSATDFPRNKFLIVYYGFPETHADPDFPLRKGLVIIDDKMKQATKGNIKVRGFKRNKKYYYESKHFDIDYKPIARTLIKSIPNI